MRIENQNVNATMPSKSQIENAKSTSRTSADFGTHLQSAQKAAANQDSISLTGSSYEQRLESLKKLHAQTDYSGMSDLDKARLIESRFEEVFPNIHAINGGLYSYAGQNSIYAKIMDQQEQQFKDVSSAPLSKIEATRTENAKYMFGYGGLSDSAIRAKVNEKYSGGTLEDKCGAVYELMNMGLDEGAGPYMLNQIRREMVQGTEAKYGNLHRDNPLRVNAMISYATNTTMNWTQLTRATKEWLNGGSKNDFVTGLNSNLDKFLDSMIHTNTDKEG